MYEKEKIHPTGLMGVYAELAELIGIDSTVEIYEHFKGQQITFPIRLYTRDFVITKATSNKTIPIKRLASEYGYTERRLRQLLKETKEHREL